MPRPLCIKCQVEYIVEKNDIVVEQMSGTESYKLWCADLFKCPLCGHLMASGYGRREFAGSFEASYEEKRKECEKRIYRDYELNTMIKLNYKEQKKEKNPHVFASRAEERRFNELTAVKMTRECIREKSKEEKEEKP